MSKISDETILDAYTREGSAFKAAVALGLHERTVEKRLAKIRLTQGGSNADNSALRNPGVGREISRVTSQVDADGRVIRQSIREVPEQADVIDEVQGKIVKTTVQVGAGGRIERTWERRVPDDAADAITAAAQAIADMKPFDPAPPMLELPGIEDLYTLYPFADAHIGMLAWNKEGGDDWDSRIAREILHAAADELMLQAPPSKRAAVVFLGDWLHFDGLDPVTPLSKHILDADSRYSKVVKIAVDVAMYVVRRALSMHEHVDVIAGEGNHDLAGTVWMQELLFRMFENEPRVTIQQSPKPYYVLTFGEIFLGFHHGHLKGPAKASDLIAYFSQDFREEWGKCSKHYIHTGHKHFLSVDGSRGAIIHQHMTLAARDAYSARYGYLGYRGVQAITYHKVHGQRSAITVTPEMLED